MQADDISKGAPVSQPLGAPVTAPIYPHMQAPLQAPKTPISRPPFRPLCRLSRAFLRDRVPKAGNFFSRNFFKPNPFYRAQLKIRTA